jgi:hypothetical protein
VAKFQGLKDLETLKPSETLKLSFLAISDDPSLGRRSSIEEFSTRAFFKR